MLVTPRCADPLYRRSVRVSMGTVFQVPWTRLDAVAGRAGPVCAPGFTVGAPTGADAGTPVLDLDELAADPPYRLALVLGTEGDGLAPAPSAADLAVRIPMPGGVDSLNVAAASAVASGQPACRRKAEGTSSLGLTILRSVTGVCSRPSPSRTRAPGSSAAKWPGSASFERRTPLPMTTKGGSDHRRVDQQRPPVRETDSG